MKNFVTILLFLLSGISGIAQTQQYDVLSYQLPKGWQQTDMNGGRQLTVTNNKTGEYATAWLIKSAPSDSSALNRFHFYWNKLVAPTVKISGQITMPDPVQDNGWNIVSGLANYTEGNKNGTATLLAASNGGHSTGVVLMTNSNKYQAVLQAFIQSLQLSKSATVSNKPVVNNAITGLWVDYAVEKNSYQQYTTGYLRKEYKFNADGTYTYRKKNFLSSSTQIHFVTETGTYTVNGSQLTITPKKGTTEFWNKAKSLKNNEWGSRVKSTSHLLEKITYNFEILEDPNYSNSIILKPGKATLRDGGQFNNADDPFKFNYSFRKMESLIDNPPVPIR